MEVKEPAVSYSNLPYMSPAEFLEWERKQEMKHEYLAGKIYAMSGASLRHNVIASNLYTAIGNALKDKPCRVFASDLRVEIKSKESYVYPDATIVCGDAELKDDSNADTITNPAVVVEILSPSTATYDTQRKLFFYLQIPTLNEIIFIDSTTIAISYHRRTTDSNWKFDLLDKPEDVLVIETINSGFLLQDIYRDVKF